jgi:hypothetical protein
MGSVRLNFLLLVFTVMRLVPRYQFYLVLLVNELPMTKKVTSDKDMVDEKETSATVIVGDGKEVPATSQGTLLLATEDNEVIKLPDVLACHD